MAEDTEDLSWLNEEGDSGAVLDVVEGEGAGSTPALPPTPYALDLDLWGKRQGRELLKHEGYKELELPEEDLADLFGASFESDPKILEHCADPIKLEFMNTLMDNPDYQALHGNTQWDHESSQIAALHFSREYGSFRGKRKQQHAMDAADKSGKSPTPAQMLQREMEALASAGRASQAAAEEVKDYQDMQDAMGVGKGSGGGQTIPTAQLKTMFKRLKNDPTLKEICENAGRYRMLARSKQRQKVAHGYDDMVGIEMGDDISRMLASELAQMGHPDLEMEAVRRFVEREMMCREYQGVESVGKGPVIFMMDESGSMFGPPNVNAKAFALSMAWLAKSQNRWCCLIGWSDGGRIRSIVLPPNNWDQVALMNWLCGFINGGTDFPMAQIPQLYNDVGAPKGKTDLVVITDDVWSPIPLNVKEAFLRWKQEAQCRLLGITLGSKDTSVLKEISDDYYRISQISVESEAVGEALSI